MNKLFRSFFCVSIFISVALSLEGLASADTTYKTQKGFVFTEVSDPNFGITWRAPNGLIWSQYIGRYDNLGALGPVPIVDSEDYPIVNSTATKVCEKLNASLPTIAQYRVLAGFFANSEDFLRIYPSPGDEPISYWTRNGADKVDPTIARFCAMAPHLDPYGDAVYAAKKLYVMCVR